MFRGRDGDKVFVHPGLELMIVKFRQIKAGREF